MKIIIFMNMAIFQVQLQTLADIPTTFMGHTLKVEDLAGTLKIFKHPKVESKLLADTLIAINHRMLALEAPENTPMGNIHNKVHLQALEHTPATSMPITLDREARADIVRHITNT